VSSSSTTCALPYNGKACDNTLRWAMLLDFVVHVDIKCVTSLFVERHADYPITASGQYHSCESVQEDVPLFSKRMMGPTSGNASSICCR
jgi:hypothetical protein